jgi:outer membrane receptor for ferrienterochelin and colicin
VRTVGLFGLLVAAVLGGCDTTGTSPMSPHLPGTERVAERAEAVPAGPGINIRGTPADPTRLGPLIFVDGDRVGRHVESDSPLHDLSPADVSRIEVVKGRIATKIYGAEARQGVILVWTKDFDGRHGTGHDVGNDEVHSSDETTR